ncbi:MAG: tetratricopeptide repeat protein [Odoribacter sp.]
MEKEIKILLEAGQRQEAIKKIEAYLQQEGENADLLLLLGELIYAEGRMPEALNKFNAVLRIRPDNQKARNYVVMINNILGYYCKDLFNP